MAMRLVTRSDFDGLACGALLLEAGVIDHWKFAHPKDLQDGLIPIDSNDCDWHKDAGTGAIPGVERRLQKVDILL